MLPPARWLTCTNEADPYRWSMDSPTETLLRSNCVPNSYVGYTWVVADRTTAKTARATKPSSGKKETGGVSAAHGKARTGRETGGNPKELRREIAPRARTGAQRTSSTAKSPLSRSAGASYLPDRQSEFVIRVLGNQRAADLLRVSKSQPSRWKSGEETP